MAPSRIDLINRAIPKAFRGYDCLAVDRLVQDLSDALARATDERIVLTAKVHDLEARLAAHAEREASLQEALVAGRRMGEDIRETAQKEAQVILETARVKAEALLQNARLRLARAQEEATQARKAKLRFEMQLRAVIADHTRLLDLNGEENSGAPPATDGTP